MNVNNPAAFIALVDLPLAVNFHPASDPCKYQVPIKDFHQPGRLRPSYAFRLNATMPSGGTVMVSMYS